MSETAVLEIGREATWVLLLVAAPMLIAGTLVGVAVALVQALTSIQESTLSFVPKMIAVGIALIVTGNWMLHTMISFTNELFARLPGLLGQG